MIRSVNRADHTLDFCNQTQNRWRSSFAAHFPVDRSFGRCSTGGSWAWPIWAARARRLASAGATSSPSHIDSLIGTEVGIPGDDAHRIEQVIRLDALPTCGTCCIPKRSLQNPDFVLLGRRDDELTLQAADAKFSIETARSKQVSVDMLTALAAVGPTYTELLGEWHERGTIVPGLFFAPQSAMTAFVLSGGRGITRATVKPAEVVLLESSATRAYGRHSGRCAPAIAWQRWMVWMRQQQPSCLSACTTCGCRAPLAQAGSTCIARSSDRIPPVVPTSTRSMRRSPCEHPGSRSAYDLVSRWALDAELVRADRSAITQAAALPLPNRELREWVMADAEAMGCDAPSLNRVRKHLQRWVHDQRVGGHRPDRTGSR